MKKKFYIAWIPTLLTLGFLSFFPKIFKNADDRWRDVYFKIRAPLAHAGDVVLVTIDEKSINQLGRWPWPRSQMAKLIDELGEYQVKAAGFDITFSEPTAEDGALAESLKKAENFFLGYFFYLSPKETQEAHLSPKEAAENEQSIFPSRLSLSSRQWETSGTKVFGVQTNVPQIAKSSDPSHQGFFNVLPDEDGILRLSPLVLFYKGNAYPSLALQVASRATGFSPIPLYERDGALNGLSLGQTKIPLTSTGQFLINYRGPAKTFLHLSAVDVLEGKVPKEKLRDKIVLVGATAIGIYDMRVIPMDPNFPGLEIQANVVDNILKGDFLVSNETTRNLSLILILVAGLVLGFSTTRLRAVGSLVVFIVFLGSFIAGGYFLFLKKNILLGTSAPVLNGFLVYGGITIYRYFTEERERRKIKKTFQYYLSPSVIKTLLEHPEQLKLGGERRELTVLFSDIRGFTSKSEKLPPEKLVALLNDYFTVMTDVVFEHEGTVDKYMGDAVMALFGAPLPQEDHALRAALTALAMSKKLKQHKKEWCEKYGIDDLQIGIGIHTGLMVVGNMGSAKRFNYTVIGDSVNLASRLEGLNKEYGTQIIVSEAHYQKVKEHVAAKKLGDIRVRGKEEMVAVYELVGGRK